MPSGEFGYPRESIPNRGYLQKSSLTRSDRTSSSWKKGAAWNRAREGTDQRQCGSRNVGNRGGLAKNLRVLLFASSGSRAARQSTMTRRSPAYGAILSDESDPAQ